MNIDSLINKSLEERLELNPELDYENLYEELITEMAHIRRPNSNEFMLLAINPDPNRIGEPYFKMYDKESWNKATKVARISFFEPKIIIHRSQGVRPWIKLTREDIDNLEDYLDSPWKGHPGMTVWDGLKYSWNYEWGLETGTEVEYINGEYDDLNKDEPSYIPSYLEPPDYRKLMR